MTKDKAKLLRFNCPSIVLVNTFLRKLFITSSISCLICNAFFVGCFDNSSKKASFKCEKDDDDGDDDDDDDDELDSDSKARFFGLDIFFVTVKIK